MFLVVYLLVFVCVFFFFKQKTAYEMRISDWSSDVCSSDLGGTIPVDAFRHRAIWNETLTRIEMHLEATRNVDFTIDDHGFAMAAGETIHTENSHKYGPRDARMLLLAGEWRSEEHTSELTSLMRISYAALCLKKKKKK